MATVFKRKGSPFWWGRVYSGGKDVWISTKTTKKSDAEKTLLREREKRIGEANTEELVTDALKQARLLKDQDSIKRILPMLFDQVVNTICLLQDPREQDQNRRQFAERLLEGASIKMAIADAWKAWHGNPKKRNPGPRTLKDYRGHWDHFLKWVDTQNPAPRYIHEITPSVVEAYVSSLWKAGITPRTYNGHTAFLRSMFTVMKTQAGLSHNVWDGIPTMSKEQVSKRNLTPEELITVCAKATGQLRYWVAIGLYTGLRLGDVVTLKWREVDLEKGFIERVPLKTRRKNKTVRFPLHPSLQGLLKELQAKAAPGAEFLFPTEVKTYVESNWKISQLVQKHFTDCGIKTTEAPEKDSHRKISIVKVGFHSLRHSFVSLCAANRVPQVAIMELVGHGSPAMTDLYSHASDDQKAAAVSQLPALAFAAAPTKS